MEVACSRCGLLTGCYPNRLGINGALGPHSQVGISAGEMTLAELVNQQLQKTGGKVAVVHDARRSRPRARAKAVALES